MPRMKDNESGRDGGEKVTQVAQPRHGRNPEQAVRPSRDSPAIPACEMIMRPGLPSHSRFRPADPIADMPRVGRDYIAEGGELEMRLLQARVSPTPGGTPVPEEARSLRKHLSAPSGSLSMSGPGSRLCTTLKEYKEPNTFRAQPN